MDANQQAQKYGYAVRYGQIHSGAGKPLGVFIIEGKRGRLRYETGAGQLLASGPPDGVGTFLEKFYYAKVTK
jgi:hypothetical protein